MGLKTDSPGNRQPLKVRAGDGPGIQVLDSVRQVEASVALPEPGNVLHSLVTPAHTTHIGGVSASGGDQGGTK